MPKEGNNTPEQKTTAEVAIRLGVKRETIILTVWRHPELRPARLIPPRNFLWTESEIERLIAHRAARKGGKPSQQA